LKTKWFWEFCLIFKGEKLPRLLLCYERISQNPEIRQAVHQKPYFRVSLPGFDIVDQSGFAFDRPQYDQCCDRIKKQ
jgi:hypothetical protein